ncbi:MAG: acyl-CoA carboxylase biotin carboxyl carrier protein subunit [Fimbriimonadaceae bacterium]
MDGTPVDLATDAAVSHLSDRVLVRTSEGTFSGVAVATGDAFLVSFRGQCLRLERNPPRTAVDAAGASGNITAPMPGMIVEVLAKPGATLKRGAKLVVLEAMKTQIPLTMPFDGRVESVLVEVGNQVEQDAAIAVVKPIETA